MTNRQYIFNLIIDEMVRASDEELEKWFTDNENEKKIDSICDYCQKKYGKCEVEKTNECRASSTEWLNAETVEKVKA